MYHPVDESCRRKSLIEKANVRDVSILAELACKLWPDHSVAEMRAEFADDCELDHLLYPKDIT